MGPSARVGVLNPAKMARTRAQGAAAAEQGAQQAAGRADQSAQQAASAATVAAGSAVHAVGAAQGAAAAEQGAQQAAGRAEQSAQQAASAATAAADSVTHAAGAAATLTEAEAKTRAESTAVLAMADSIVLDGYTLNQYYNGSLTCLGAGSFGFALQATKDGADAAVKLGHCAGQEQLKSAKEEMISKNLPEHQHVVRLRSFSEHAANSGSFLQSGTLMSQVLAIAQQIKKIKHTIPNWMKDAQGAIRTPPTSGTYCVLGFDLGGTQNLLDWYENCAGAGDTPPDTELRTIAKQMASALAHLHDHKIKHYDFKAENIMVTNGSAGIVTKLIDFGLARNDDPDNHPGLPGVTGGTPRSAAPELWAPLRYRARRDAPPEQFNGKAADVWSYGGMSLATSSPTCHLVPKHLAPRPRQCCWSRSASASPPSPSRTARGAQSSRSLSLGESRRGSSARRNFAARTVSHHESRNIMSRPTCCSISWMRA